MKPLLERAAAKFGPVEFLKFDPAKGSIPRNVPDPECGKCRKPAMLTPYEVLLDAFPFIRTAFPKIRLKVFSGFAVVNQTAVQDDPYTHLYERCIATDDVDYIGPLPQPALAGELSRAAALAYPSTFMETSCISALEAMAAGLLVLTTRTAALPETTAGFAQMVEYRHDHTRLAQDFADMTMQALEDLRSDPGTAMARRAEQIAYVREHHTWPKLALEWEAWLSQIVKEFRN